MKTAGKFASRAIRQYRSRDIFPYLSLRYFLESSFAKTDHFAKVIAPQITRATVQPTYLAVPYFKERDENGAIKYRDMHLPTACEALAEAALIELCSSLANVPDRSVCFSYWPTGSEDDSGYFEPYMIGLKARQAAVAEAIVSIDRAVVTYVDIKKFYPSITVALAKETWDKFSKQISLPGDFHLLGHKLIDSHSEPSNGRVVTGPMFSHFLGNLVLSEIDARCKERASKIFRYVDDFIIVGGEDRESDISWLQQSLAGLGFEVHGPGSEKSLTVDGATWLQSARDFESGELAKGWMRLVGDIKKQLLVRPHTGSDLLLSLVERGFRMPLKAYEAAVQEASTFERVRQLRIWHWLIARTQKVTVESIVKDAEILRTNIERQIDEIFNDDAPDTNSSERGASPSSVID